MRVWVGGSPAPAELVGELVGQIGCLDRSGGLLDVVFDAGEVDPTLFWRRLDERPAGPWVAVLSVCLPSRH